MDFEEIIHSQETAVLDHKRDFYDLTTPHGKSSFLVDLLSMANTVREQDALITYGVDDKFIGDARAVGVIAHPDDADLQTLVTDHLHPRPTFSYERITHKGLEFGLLRIKVDKRGPFMAYRPVNSDKAGKLESLNRNAVYYRQGTRNSPADSSQIKAISLWMSGTSPNPSKPSGTPWGTIQDRIANGRAAGTCAIVTTKLPLIPDTSYNIGDRWSWVIDLDTRSDIDGFFKTGAHNISTSRSIHTIVPGETQHNPNLSKATYWFYARGIEGRTQGYAPNDWKEWIKLNAKAMTQQITAFASSSLPAPTFCLVLAYDFSTLKHLATIFDKLFESFQDSIEIVIATDSPAMLAAVQTTYDVEVVDIDLNHLMEGLRSLKTDRRSDRANAIPSSSGVFVEIEPTFWAALSEDMEMVTSEKGLEIPGDRQVPRDFYRGMEVSWHELMLGFDIERSTSPSKKHSLANLVKDIESALSEREAIRFTLHHDPGAGGTTLAKHVLWSLHQIFPCATLKSIRPRETSELLFALTQQTGCSILLLVDGNFPSASSTELLYNELRGKKVPVVLFQVHRSLTTRKDHERSRFLPAQLSDDEALRFAKHLGREVPGRAAELDRIVHRGERETWSAFFFGLCAFERDFLRLNVHVQTKLEGATQQQLRALLYLSIAYHYGHESLHEAAFASIFALSSPRDSRLSEVLTDAQLELLVQAHEVSGYWRPAHNLFAEEIIRQIVLPKGADHRLVGHYLAEYAMDFARFCRGKSSIPSEEMLGVARAVFIERGSRNIAEADFQDSTVRAQFSPLMMDIEIEESKISILKELTELFPEEPHFWAHLGRLYAASETANFEEALIAINEAIEKNLEQGEADDALLHHMKGMIYARRMRHQLRARETDDAVESATFAAKSFARARELKPYNEHGFISDVQARIELIEILAKESGVSAIDFVSRRTTPVFVRESLDEASDLMEQVRKNRGEESPSDLEEGTLGRLYSLYGNYSRSLQLWDNLLQNGRGQLYLPPIRRQIIWTYYAKAKRNWDHLEASQAERCLGLIEENLKEEPNNERNIRIWMRIARHPGASRSIERAYELVTIWRIKSASIEALFYSYVFKALAAIHGSATAVQEARDFQRQCSDLARNRRSRTQSTEALGYPGNLSELVSVDRLGFNPNTKFWADTTALKRISGRIASANNGAISGKVELDCGLEAHFVLSKANLQAGDKVNRRVEFYLGFSYDGLQAYEVSDQGFGQA